MRSCRFPARLTPKEVSARNGCASAITADGQRVAFAFDGRAEVWRVDSAECTAAIDVGGQKQLFIDDLFLKQPRQVKLRMHPATKTGERTLESSQPWENASLNWFSGLSS